MAVSFEDKESGRKRKNKTIDNRASDEVYITRDKITNILKEHIDKVSYRKIMLNLIISYIPFTMSLFSSEFKDVMSLQSRDINTFFIFVWIAFTIYLVVTITRAIKNAMTVDDVVDIIFNKKKRKKQRKRKWKFWR